jgi:hypothetical protein
VFEAEGVQQRRVEVVHVDRIGHRRKPKIVRGAIRQAGGGRRGDEEVRRGEGNGARNVPATLTNRLSVHCDCATRDRL